MYEPLQSVHMKKERERERSWLQFVVLAGISPFSHALPYIVQTNATKNIARNKAWKNGDSDLTLNLDFQQSNRTNIMNEDGA